MPEPATGFTLYTDMILSTLPEMQPRRRLLLPPGTDPALAASLRDSGQGGWITVAALARVDDWHAEAERLGCDHVLEAGRPVPVHERRS